MFKSIKSAEYPHFLEVIDTESCLQTVYHEIPKLIMFLIQSCPKPRVSLFNSIPRVQKHKEDKRIYTCSKIIGAAEARTQLAEFAFRVANHYATFMHMYSLLSVCIQTASFFVIDNRT